MMGNRLEELLRLPTLEVARRLLGAEIVRELPEGRLRGRIVETEGYLHNDPACHAVRELPGGICHRQTRRNASMFGPPGRAYVYFTYGNHYMLNVVTEAEGIPGAVLIRALEPLDGLEIMLARRQVDPRQLTNGPGKLTRAFGIGKELDGHDLAQPPLQLIPADPLPDEDIVATTRIGITRAVDKPWRFYIKGNAWVSRK
ncbi:MAG: DNA-3-methyladenine glycosylase [Armatimonadota bacterium]